MNDDEDKELVKDEDTPEADAADDQVEQEDLLGAEPMDIDKESKKVGHPHNEEEPEELDPDNPL